METLKFLDGSVSYTDRNSKSFSLILHTLDAIEKTHRLNRFLNETYSNLSEVSTMIFHDLQECIITGKSLTDRDTEVYFNTSKHLHKISLSASTIGSKMQFAPPYELDMYVLGIPYTFENSNKYAISHYAFITNEITYSEFLERTQQITNK